MGRVVLINQFQVAVGRDDAFIAMWTKVNTYMRSQPGFVHTRLHRALRDDTLHRYVNVATWESLEEFQAAHGPTFRQMVAGPEWAEFPSTPAVYSVAAEAQGEVVPPP